MAEKEKKTNWSDLNEILRDEKTLLLSLLTTLLFFLFGERWLADLGNPLWFALITGWLFTVILFSAFAIVRHAESLAELLGEPLGTLILTLSVITIELLMISAVMLTGEEKPTLARDTMFGILMIVLNGMVGVSLLVGGWKHYEQDYNIKGAKSFLALLVPFSVLGLILPSYTRTTVEPTFSTFQAIFVSVMTTGIYAVFLFIQTTRHREFFISPDAKKVSEHNHNFTVRNVPYHTGFLLAFLAPLVYLAKKLAVPVDYGTIKFGAPLALGGFLIALLVLAPEVVSAIKAAKRDELQRAVNLSLGSGLATIGLTIPAVLIIGLVTDKKVIIGLDPVDSILLVLSLSVCVITFSKERTNILLGAVHLLLFLAYLMLIFES